MEYWTPEDMYDKAEEVSHHQPHANIHMQFDRDFSYLFLSHLETLMKTSVELELNESCQAHYNAHLRCQAQNHWISLQAFKEEADTLIEEDCLPL